jgi:hypothetical protein
VVEPAPAPKARKARKAPAPKAPARKAKAPRKAPKARKVSKARKAKARKARAIDPIGVKARKADPKANAACTAYRKTWELLRKGDTVKAREVFGEVFDLLFPVVLRSAETGGLMRRAISLQARYSSGLSAAEYFALPRGTREIGRKFWAAAHKMGCADENSRDAAGCVFGKEWQKLVNRAAKGKARPFKKLSEKGCNDAIAAGYFSGFAARRLREIQFHNHRAFRVMPNGKTKGVKKPEAIGDRDIVDTKTAPVDAPTIRAEVKASILADLSAVLKSQDATLVKAWAVQMVGFSVRGKGRAKGGEVVGRPELVLGISKKNACKRTARVTELVALRLADSPVKERGEVILEKARELAGI